MEDHTIVAGLGCHPGLEEGETTLFLDGPQATSTVATKISREEVTRKYLYSLQEASEEGSTGEFRSLRSTSRGSHHLPSTRDSGQDSSGGMATMMALPLINTEAMSGLSSSRFLVDPTHLNTDGSEEGKVEQREERESRTMPDLVPAPSNTALSDGDDSDLSQGELLPCDGVETEASGLPSALLESQKSLLEGEKSLLNGGGVRELLSMSPHLARSAVPSEVDVFACSRLQFDASQISARSTTHGHSEEAIGMSKLLSTSCNSLGSLDGLPQPSLCPLWAAGEPEDDWLEAHQGELACALEGEEFHAPNLIDFEEEEKELIQANRFQMDVAPDPLLNLSCFSGIHGVAEITVRPSWVGSPERELLGPDNRMLVDDYLQARSEALGSLGKAGDPSTRPNFGNAVHSPPSVRGRLQPLLGTSTVEESVSSCDTDSSVGQGTFTSNALSGGSQENTVMSRAGQTSPPTLQGQKGTTVRGLSEEKSVRVDLLQEVEELEASVCAGGPPLKADCTGSLLARVLATDPPSDLVERILRLTKASPAPPVSLEVTELEASMEVLELRRRKEEVLRQQQKGTRPPRPPGKENMSQEGVAKPQSAVDRRPLQTRQAVEEQGPGPTLPHKRMEKLKAARTTSAPGAPSRVDTSLEESLRGAQYRSRLLEDTDRLLLPSFNQGRGVVDSSTPCVPRTRPTLPDSLHGKQPPPTITGQRPLPRMGLRSSIKGPGRVLASGESEALRNQQLGSSRAPLPQGNGAKQPASVSTILQSQGGAAPPTPHTTISTATAQAHSHSYRHQLLQEGVSQQAPSPTGVDVQQQLVLPDECVVGMAAYISLPLHNPSPRWLQVSLRLLQETLDGNAPAVSALLFQSSHFLEPRSRREVQIGVCSLGQGQLEALLGVQVGEMTSPLAQGTSIHTVVVRATVTLPKVEIQCEGKEHCVDFGVVGEGCTLSRAVTVTNHCPQPLPLIFHLQQVGVSSPIFCWEAGRNQCGRVVSATRLACELPPKTPTTFSLTLKAPHLDDVTVDEHGRVPARSLLTAMLDTPTPAPLTLTTLPLKAVLGVVQLEVLRTQEPVVVEATPHDTGTAHLTLRNGSSFPLHVRLSVTKDPNTHCTFSLHPDTLTLTPGAQATPTLLFIPGGQVGTMESVLVLCIEPNGMEFKIAVSGVSRAPAPTLLPRPASSSTGNHHHRSHKSVTKCSSEPLPQQSEKSLSAALDSTKPRLVFGTVGVGGSSWQRLVLRNNLTTQDLPLSLTITGSSAFQVCECGSEEGQERLEVVLKPCQELALAVLLRPTTVEPLAATLVCHHRSSRNPFKWKIPLQGYGGQGELEVQDSKAGQPITLKDLSPGLPAIFHTTLTNTGHRTIFLSLQLFSDKQCTEPAADLSVRPTQLVVGVGQSQEVFLVANSSPELLACTPGLLGVLQATTGDEILRQRYRRLKNKEVKARRITDPSLLKMDWAGEFSNEREAHLEADTLPPQPEDAVVFFNACTKIQVDVWGEQRPNEDNSSTMFACLAGEQTMADLSVTQGERLGGHYSPPTLGNQSPGQATPAPAVSWDVLPQTLCVRATDPSPLVFFVVNFSSTQQMLEMCSSCEWLAVEPREAVLPGLSSVKLTVRLHPPRTLTSTLTLSLTVMGENESRGATITLLPASEGGEGTTNQQQQPATTHQSMPTATTTTTTIQLPNTKKPSHQPTTKAHPPPPTTKPSSATVHLPATNSHQSHHATRRNPSTTTTCHPHSQNTVAAEPPTQDPGLKTPRSEKAEGSQVKLVSDNITFPDTLVGQETCIKVMLKNVDTVVHSVQAAVTHGPFMVRHTQFKIKSVHYVSVPVYFRPQRAGVFSGHLQMTVLEDGKVLPVHLSGRAVL